MKRFALYTVWYLVLLGLPIMVIAGFLETELGISIPPVTPITNLIGACLGLIAILWQAGVWIIIIASLAITAFGATRGGFWRKSLATTGVVLFIIAILLAISALLGLQDWLGLLPRDAAHGGY
jgi:hypothetical protein